jgi:DNA polymerase
MLVGEAPGQEEDATGIPFSGRSGKLLDLLLEQAGIPRSQLYITNTVKCRPPENRNPKADEIAACSEWLELQIVSIRPAVIAPLGNFATKTLTGSSAGITAVHGQLQTRKIVDHSVGVWPLFHPAAALRSTTTRELLRQDLKSLAELLERLGG